MHDEFATCGRVHLPGAPRRGEESGRAGKAVKVTFMTAMWRSHPRRIAAHDVWRKMGGEGNIYAGSHSPLHATRSSFTEELGEAGSPAGVP